MPSPRLAGWYRIMQIHVVVARREDMAGNAADGHCGQIAFEDLTGNGHALVLHDATIGEIDDPEPAENLYWSGIFYL